MSGKLLSIPLLFVIIGSAITLSALFADRLGLDPSAGWGRIRIALLIIGVFLTIGAGLAWRYLDEALNMQRRIQTFVENLPGVVWTRKNLSRINLSRLFRDYWPALPISVLVILIYVWFVSSGTWSTWVSPTHRYADLARGFQQGNLYLPIKIRPNLLTSPDPYDPQIGLGVQGPLDVSYYKGRYYLPWGPVPALMLLLIHPIIHWRVGDLYLVFGFLGGIYLLQCSLVLIIWDRLFSNRPRWMLWMSIPLIGLAGPATFMLNNIRDARIYEAAVSGGQFFLLAGFLAALIALERPFSQWRLAFAGALWALAIGTRINLVIPIGLMVLVAAGWILRVDRWSFKTFTKLMSLCLPLILGLACLGWYNWARFGSVIESGYYYQLAGIRLQKHWNDLFSPTYIWLNSYHYLLNPMEITSEFPFFYAIYGNAWDVFSSRLLPDYYFTQMITGLLWAVPFVIFAIVPCALLLLDFLKKKPADLPKGEKPYLLNWLTLTLSGSCLAAFSFLLVFFWAAMRYMEDFMPSLMTLSIIGFWQGYGFIRQKSAAPWLYTGLGVVLAAASISMSTLVAISVNDARFEVIRFFSFAR